MRKKPDGRLRLLYGPYQAPGPRVKVVVNRDRGKYVETEVTDFKTS